MAIRERMVYAIDLVVDGAEKGLATFKTRLGEANTASGKFKVGASEAFNQVKAHAFALGTVGAGAVVTFGAKAVGAFQELAIEVGKFSDATGLSAEASSRWIEVAGDIGVESNRIERAFGRFNRVAGETPEKLDEFGVSVARTKDGLVDVDETLVNAIARLGQIKDPTERAAVAQQLFGRSWQEMAELIGMSADELRGQLAGVSDAQVINDEEVEKARELRAAWDDLSDKLTAFTLLVGEQLVPRLADAADKVTSFVEAVKPAANVIDDTAGAVDRFLGKLGPFGDGIKRVGTYLIPVYGQMKALGDGAGWLGDKLGIGGDKAGFFTGKLQELTPELESAAAALADDLTTALDEFVPQAGRASDAERDYIDSLLDGAAAARAAGEASEEQAAALEESISTLQENIVAHQEWRDSINSATDSAEASLGDFVENAETSFEEWRDELAKAIVAQAEWKNNLAQIGAETSAEFMAALADMGTAGAGLVQEIANDSSKMDQAFGLWSESANQAGRDLVGEIDSIRSEASSSATAVGQAISDGMAAGIDSAAANVGNRAAAAARAALDAARNAMRIQSPSQEMADLVGLPMVQGIAQGIIDGTPQAAIDAAEAAGEISEEVAKQMREDLRAAEEGQRMAERVGDAIVDQFEAERDRVADAAEAMLDGAKDRLAGAFGAIADQFSLEDAREVVSDQEREISEAQSALDASRAAKAGLSGLAGADSSAQKELVAAEAALAAAEESEDKDKIKAARERLKAAEESAKAAADAHSEATEIAGKVGEREEDLSDAQRALRRDNLRLFRMIADSGVMPTGPGAAQTALRQIGEAAGLTPDQMLEIVTGQRLVREGNSRIAAANSAANFPTQFTLVINGTQIDAVLDQHTQAALQAYAAQMAAGVRG